MKPTGFMSNSPEILKALSKRCSGVRDSVVAGTGTWCSRKQGGKHAPCAGSICREMAKYPRELCRAVIRGFTTQLHADGRLRHRCYGIQMVDDDPDVQLLACGPGQGYSGKYKDALTGQVLRDDLVEEARKVEVGFFDGK